MADNWLYLGDAVYARLDELGRIVLHVDSHDNPTNKVILEPSVMNSLIIFYNIHVDVKGE